jgi:hypothetical protein
MKKLRMPTRFALLFAVTAAVFAATASAAMAFSIEPLNTKFSANSTGEVGWRATDAAWNCKSANIAGTTSPTKTNTLSLTPSFTGCHAASGAGGFYLTYTNSCSKEGLVPWTLTFNENKTGNLTLNCTLNEKVAPCWQMARPQSVEHAFGWSTGSKGVLVAFSETPLKFLTLESDACKQLGLTALQRNFSGSFELPGIHLK